MRVSRKKWPVPQLTWIYGMVRVPRNLDSLFCNCPVFAPFSYWFILLALWVSSHHTLWLIRIKFLESPSRVWLLFLSFFRIIWMKILVAWRLMLISAKFVFSVAECNQDLVAPASWDVPLWAAGLFTSFVTPAACHIPLWAAWLVTHFATPALGHTPIEVVCVSEWESTSMKR